MRRMIRFTIGLGSLALAACSSGKSETKSEMKSAAPAAASENASAVDAGSAAATPPAAAIVVAPPVTEHSAPAPAPTPPNIAPPPPPVDKPMNVAPAVPAAPLPKEIEAIVNASDRTEADRALDAGRKPGEMLLWFSLKPGMKVAEIGAGRGYTTELLARAVGPTGTVYAQNPPAFIASFLKTAWPERLARPINAKVIRADRDFASPLPDDAKNLDAVVIVALYHDIVGLEVDRKAMNEAIFKALKPGGALYVIDSSAPVGSGVADVKTLHRIDEAVVQEELETAGFKFAGENNFLRNPLDTRDWNSSPSAAGARRGTSDRFAIKFIKPHHKKEAPRK